MKLKKSEKRERARLRRKFGHKGGQKWFVHIQNAIINRSQRKV